MTEQHKIESHRPPPSKESLQRMVESGLGEEVVLKIKTLNLPYEVVGLQVIDAGNSTEAHLARFVTVHPVMLKMKDEVRKLAKVNDPVLITGDTGTGKELIAQALHGEKDPKKFIAFNCAGVPETLIEAELFGHTRGAFTDAKESKIGLIKLADDGTLFLDEIGEMPMLVQAKLLRSLQNKMLRKIGSSVEEAFSCRIVCATNRNLRLLFDKGLFRRDLYARISTFELDTLSLIQRPEDVKPILESLPGGKEFVEAIKDNMLPADLAFNVRSLQAHVRRFKVLGKLPV